MLGLVALCVIGGLIAIQGCDAPPVSVTFRTSLIDGYVLQLHNRSNNRVVARVYVENKVRNQTMQRSFGVAPNEMQEIGLLEADWKFEPGENGYVEVDGFIQKIYFEIGEGNYKTW